jgi:hypothetical protein
MSSDDDNFLARWSKRKHAARRGEAPAEPAPAESSAAESSAAESSAAESSAAEPAPPPTPAPSAPPELPPIDSLQGLESDYEDFLRPDVDPATKSAALRKLFGDPHFNRMDGLDIYIDDYSKADPIPHAMLRALNQARTLGLFEKEEREEEEKRRAEGPTTGTTPAATAALEPPADPPPVEPTEPLPAGQPTKTTGA